MSRCQQPLLTKEKRDIQGFRAEWAGSIRACGPRPPSAMGGLVAPEAAGLGPEGRARRGLLPLAVCFCAFTLCLLLVLSYTQRVKILPDRDRPSNGCVFKDLGSAAASLVCSDHASLCPLL